MGEASSNSAHFLATSSGAAAGSLTDGVAVNKESQAAQAPVVLGEVGKLHPPTTKQAITAFVLILAIPLLAVYTMIKMKGHDWNGACATIGGLITLLWIYTAVTYYQ